MRYITCGTYRIKHNADSIEQARLHGEGFVERMRGAASDGALETDVQIDSDTGTVKERDSDIQKLVDALNAQHYPVPHIHRDQGELF